jgi:Cyclic nucleotide-binding domain/Major Facilitator Superfamily
VRAQARLQAAARAFALTARRPALRRAQLSFGAMWASEWAALVAVSIVAFRDGGAGVVAIVAVARMVPAALVAPFAATIADRHRRDRVLMGVGLVRALALTGAAALLAAGAATVPVYALVVVATVAQTLFRPAHSALLPALCATPDELTSANVVRALLDALAVLAGPLAAAALIAANGPAAALGACAAASLASALLVAHLRYEPPPRVAVSGRGAAREAIAGLQAIAADPAMRLLTGLTTVQTFTRGCVSVLVVVVAIDLLGGDDADVGLLNAAIGLGAVVGSLLAASVSWHGRLARCLGVGVALWGAPLAVLGGVPSASAALILLGAVGVGNALADVGVFTLLARVAPERFMARVFAGFEGVLTLGVALGAAVTAPAIDALGIRGALVALGLLAPAAAVASWPALRVLDRRIARRDEDIAVLQLVPMLRPLSEVTIESLAAAIEPLSLAARAVVFREGDAGDRFYVVVDGSVEVLRADEVIRTLHRGDCFGEIALLRADMPRTATVRAAGDGPVELYALSRERFITAVTGYASSSTAADALVDQRLDEHPTPA